jgi:hypothetical protein
MDAIDRDLWAVFTVSWQTLAMSGMTLLRSFGVGGNGMLQGVYLSFLECPVMPAWGGKCPKCVRHPPTVPKESGSERSHCV